MDFLGRMKGVRKRDLPARPAEGGKEGEEGRGREREAHLGQHKFVAEGLCDGLPLGERQEGKEGGRKVGREGGRDGRGQGGREGGREARGEGGNAG